MARCIRNLENTPPWLVFRQTSPTDSSPKQVQLLLHPEADFGTGSVFPALFPFELPGQTVGGPDMKEGPKALPKARLTKDSILQPSGERRSRSPQPCDCTLLSRQAQNLSGSLSKRYPILQDPLPTGERLRAGSRKTVTVATSGPIPILSDQSSLIRHLLQNRSDGASLFLQSLRHLRSAAPPVVLHVGQDALSQRRLDVEAGRHCHGSGFYHPTPQFQSL